MTNLDDIVGVIPFQVSKQGLHSKTLNKGKARASPQALKAEPCDHLCEATWKPPWYPDIQFVKKSHVWAKEK